MISNKIPLALSVLIASTLACNGLLPNSEAPTVASDPGNPAGTYRLPVTEDDVPRVSLEDALVALNTGAATIVDVRSAEAFEVSHIPGALHIPVETIEANPGRIDIDKNEWIITYCT